MLILLKTVIALVVIGECRRNVLGRLVQSLLALLGDAYPALCSVLFGFGPQRFVGCSDLPGDIACQLHATQGSELARSRQ